jgi:hypothetical protein
MSARCGSDKRSDSLVWVLAVAQGGRFLGEALAGTKEQGRQPVGAVTTAAIKHNGVWGQLWLDGNDWAARFDL